METDYERKKFSCDKDMPRQSAADQVDSSSTKYCETENGLTTSKHSHKHPPGKFNEFYLGGVNWPAPQSNDGSFLTKFQRLALELQDRDSQSPIESTKSSTPRRLKSGSVTGQNASRTSQTNAWRDREPAALIPCLPQLTQDSLSLKAFLPRKHKAQIVVWSDLTVATTDRLKESSKPDHIKQVLADIFILDHYKTDLRNGIIMDLYFNALQFAKNQHFSSEKTSAFFSIIKKTFEMCVETPFENLGLTFQYFKDLLLCHSIYCPPFSINLFTSEDVVRMSEYTIKSFFRHFRMYKYAFTPSINLDLILNYTGMPPPTPPPSEVCHEELDSYDMSEKLTDDTENESEKTILQEQLKNDITEFFNKEVKMLEENITEHFKDVTEELYTKITQVAATLVKSFTGEEEQEREVARDVSGL